MVVCYYESSHLEVAPNNYHVLTIHTLNESLDLILDIIVQVLKFDRAAILLLDGGELRPAAAIGVSTPEARVPAGELGSLHSTASRQTAIRQARESLAAVRHEIDGGTCQSGLVPMHRGGELIGMIEFDKHRTGGSISDDELQTMASFALPAAVAIHDALIHQDVEEWKGHLDRVYHEMEELRDLAD